MMNIIDLQDKIKDLSEQQLAREMQMPSGQMPQFLILSELMRRKKMRESFAQEQGREQSTVAQDAIAAAGMPGGFAAQMAGAMAPQTDMAENTGAVSRSAVPPAQEEVVGMAGGGIVALQEGGLAPRPRRVVRDGIIYVVDPDGRETAWGPATDQTYESANPSSGREGIYQQPRPPAGAPSIGDIPAAPSAMLPPAFSYPTNLPGVMDPDGAMPRVAPDMLRYAEQPFVEIPARDPNMDLRVAEDGAPRGGVAGFLDRAEQGFRERVLPDIRNTAAILSPFASEEEKAAAAVAMGAEPQSQTPEQAAEIAAAEQAAAEMAAVAQTQAQSQGGGGGGGGGGGIATITQSGATPSSYEQELIDMLARREKRAEQDKWLALAKFGAALMASDNPTFGGALGEAGMSAIGPLRESRETAESDRLGMLGMLEDYRMQQAQFQMQQQAARARAAGGGGGSGGQLGGPFGELSAGQGRLLAQYDSEISRLGEMMQSGNATEAQRLAAAQRLEALAAERAQIVSGLSGVPFGAGAASSQTMFDVR